MFPIPIYLPTSLSHSSLTSRSHVPGILKLSKLLCSRNKLSMLSFVGWMCARRGGFGQRGQWNLIFPRGSRVHAWEIYIDGHRGEQPRDDPASRTLAAFLYKNLAVGVHTRGVVCVLRLTGNEIPPLNYRLPLTSASRSRCIGKQWEHTGEVSASVSSFKYTRNRYLYTSTVWW